MEYRKYAGPCDVTVGILAGGRSARMGRDKAFLVWRKKAMIEHVIERLGRGRAVLISAADAGAERLRALPFPVVVDERLHYGPLEGIYRLLLASETDWTFIAAADLPLVDERLPACLLRRALAHEKERGTLPCIVVPCVQGRIHPLCGLYHKRAVSELEALFAKEEHRVRALLERTETVYVQVQECGIDPRMFFNVNTPEQFRELEHLVDLADFGKTSVKKEIRE